MMQCLFDANEKYWWWLDGMENINFLHSANNFTMKQSPVQDWLGSCSTTWDSKKEIKTRKRRNTVIEVERRIPQIYNWMRNGSLQYIFGRSKQKSPSIEITKGRSSSSIGVSKNGENWQVLINWGKYKKYIGTFSSEKQAAITYDFYAICLHLSKAKTNFSYDQELITEMIASYNSKSKSFDASRFIDRL